MPNPWLLKVLIVACFFVTILSGFVLGFTTPHDPNTWLAAGFISAGIGGCLLVIP